MRTKGHLTSGTILQALEADKEHLLVFCETCRFYRQINWKDLLALRLGDRIETLTGRLRCERCGQRPRSVEAAAQSDAPGYVTKCY